jgi:hypothetical protein
MIASTMAKKAFRSFQDKQKEEASIRVRSGKNLTKHEIKI